MKTPEFIDRIIKIENDRVSGNLVGTNGTK